MKNVFLNGGAHVTVPANTMTNTISLTPEISGTYKIWTESTQGDPHFRITNVTAGTQPVVAQTDISATNKNAELTIELLQGNTYYIEAFHYALPCCPEWEEMFTFDYFVTSHTIKLPYLF